MIYDIPPVNNYVGNSSATTFDFNFYIENTSQLEVYLYDSYGTKTKLTENVDYSVNEVRNENGSYITFPLQASEYDILNENQKLSIVLSLPVSQETQYNNSSLLNLSSLEYSLDYITRLIQILSRKIELCIKVEEGESVNPKLYINSIKAMATEVASAKATVNQYLSSTINYYNLNTQTYNAIQQYQERFDALSGITDEITRIENAALKKDGSNITSAFFTEFKDNITDNLKDYIALFGLQNHSSTNLAYFNKDTVFTATVDGWVDFVAMSSTSSPVYYDIYEPNASSSISRYFVIPKLPSGSQNYFTVVKEFLPKDYSIKVTASLAYCFSSTTAMIGDQRIRFTPAI